MVGWKLSNTLSANNCTDLVKECIEQYGCPEIINSDQGVQYTSKKWVE
ncbi:IS3 family transposase, partial [Porphyromonas levii]